MVANTFERYPESRLIGISGSLGAGKDTAANFLVERGFMHVSTGDVLRAEADKRGLDHERTTLIEIGVELRKREIGGGAGALVLQAIRNWEEQRAMFKAGLVMSGLRLAGEGQEIKDQLGTLVFIDAPVEERYQRLVARGRGGEVGGSLAEFIEHERVEYGGTGGAERPHLRAVKARADVVIQNNSTEQAFRVEFGRSLGIAA